MVVYRRQFWQTSAIHKQSWKCRLLGLIGKLLTGPWMARFYTSLDTQVNHIDGIGIVKNVVTVLKQYVESPHTVLTTMTDFFGNVLQKSMPEKPDMTLQSLQIAPFDEDAFSSMMGSALTAVIVVLERQYERYFGLDITEKLKDETRPLQPDVTT